MNFKQSVKFIRSLPKRVSVVLIGPPGVGKSAIGKAVGEEENVKVCVRDLCSHQPEDLLGAYKIVGEVSKYFPPDWLKQFDAEAGEDGVLLLDDVGAAPVPTQVATFGLVQEHRAGSLTIRARVVVTTNRREDRSAATALPAALINKVAVVEVTPDVVEWAAWARTQNIAEDVIAFVTTNPTLFSQYPKDANKNGQFATPRSWANLGEALNGWKDGISSEMLESFIGNVAPVFHAFLASKKSYPDPMRVLLSPKEAVPKPIADLDVLAGLIQALGCTAATARGRQPDIPVRFLKALAHVTQNNQEFSSAGLQSYFNNGGSHQELVEAAEKTKDKGVQRLLTFLRESVTSK